LTESGEIIIEGKDGSNIIGKITVPVEVAPKPKDMITEINELIKLLLKLIKN